MKDLTTVLREAVCTHRAGVWLCRDCSSPIDQADGIQCRACERATVARRAREHAARPHSSHAGARARETLRRLCEEIPDWPHLATPEAFAARISSTKLRAVAENWVPDNGSVLILGPSGVGKSSAAARAIRRYTAASGSTSAPAWVTAHDLIRAAHEFRLGSGPEPELWRRCATAQIVVIDELGPEPARYAGDIFDLANRRYARRAPTIVTSGLTPLKIQERYGDALYRRLTEAGIGHLVDAH